MQGVDRLCLCLEVTTHSAGKGAAPAAPGSQASKSRAWTVSRGALPLARLEQLSLTLGNTSFHCAGPSHSPVSLPFPGLCWGQQNAEGCGPNLDKWAGQRCGVAISVWGPSMFPSSKLVLVRLPPTLVCLDLTPIQGVLADTKSCGDCPGTIYNVI